MISGQNACCNGLVEPIHVSAGEIGVSLAVRPGETRPNTEVLAQAALLAQTAICMLSHLGELQTDRVVLNGSLVGDFPPLCA